MAGLAWDTTAATRAWDAALHPRIPHGKGGGQFSSKPATSTATPWSTSGDVVHYHGSLGINRADMPQLSGTLTDGSYAPSSVMVPQFIDYLRAQGISVHSHRVPARSLRPTQTTGSMKAIRGIADELKDGRMTDTKPITVSMDHRVLDGHHNWAGRLLADSEGGRPGLPAGMPVVQVGLPMRELITQAKAFGQIHGIKQRKTGEHANPAFRMAGAMGGF
jgi:hypothetical protein